MSSNRPQLTDKEYLQKLVSEQKTLINQEIVNKEPTFTNQLITKIKSSTYSFILNNIFIILLVLILLCFLFYRYLNRSKPEEITTEEFISEKQEESIGRKNKRHIIIKKNTSSKSKSNSSNQNDTQNQDQNEEQEQDQNQDKKEEQNKITNDLLNITNDRDLVLNNMNNNNIDLSVINSSSYMPYNLRSLTNLYASNVDNYKLV